MHKIAVFCDSTPHALHCSEGNWRSRKMKPLAGCLLGVNIQEMLILLMMSFHSLDVERIYWMSTSIYSGYVESIYWVSTSVFSGLYLLWALTVISLHETFLVRLPGLLSRPCWAVNHFLESLFLNLWSVQSQNLNHGFGCGGTGLWCQPSGSRGRWVFVSRVWGLQKAKIPNGRIKQKAGWLSGC